MTNLIKKKSPSPLIISIFFIHIIRPVKYSNAVGIFNRIKNRIFFLKEKSILEMNQNVPEKNGSNKVVFWAKE